MVQAPRELSRYVNDEQPFGPIATERIYDREVLDYLFESDNEFAQEAARMSPTIVVGRRGSGKTAFLLSSKAQDGSRGIRINTHDVFASVSAVVRALGARNAPFFVGHVADLWEAALWHCVMAELTDHATVATSNSQVRTVRDYLLALTSDPWDDSRCSALKAFCRELLRQYESAAGAAPLEPSRFAAGDTRFAEARESARELAGMPRASAGPLVLMDSMEDFDDLIEFHRETTAGLLNFIGSRREDPRCFQVRMSVPAELYSRLAALSRAPLKDFSQQVILHWKAAEILRLATHRLRTYLTVVRPELRDAIPTSFASTTGHGELLRDVLPNFMVNGLGGEEDPIAYLMRHTQLLPRQVLTLLNRVWTTHFADTSATFPISERSIKLAVSAVEVDIAAEICEAYRLLYPRANEVLKAVIPHLSTVFSHQELHGAFRHHARRVMQIQDPEADSYDLREMLTEMGIAGRVVEETERYIVGEFEYTQAGRLVVSEEERLCLHPIFASTFHTRDFQYKARRPTQAVYAYGSDPDHDTLRWRV